MKSAISQCSHDCLSRSEQTGTEHSLPCTVMAATCTDATDIVLTRKSDGELLSALSAAGPLPVTDSAIGQRHKGLMPGGKSTSQRSNCTQPLSLHKV
eukprot:COSAG02_NODE_2022_length_10084_cov_2.725643_6_plen_97_part_00